MASGNVVVEVIKEMPQGSSYATLDVRVGAASPAESVEVYDFDASTIEYMDFLCRLSEDYDGGGLTFTIAWAASSATSNATRWGIAIRAIPDDTEDLDTTAHSYDFNDVDATAPSASGEVAYDTITFTAGADMDSWAVGELAIVRIRRNASHANDTMTGDAELLAFSGKET